jgi:hypothetical protein
MPKGPQGQKRPADVIGLAKHEESLAAGLAAVKAEPDRGRGDTL